MRCSVGHLCCRKDPCIYHQPQAETEELAAATVAALVGALEECADDLEAEISSRYSAVRHYACMAADEKRDMEPVIRARAALALYREGGR